MKEGEPNSANYNEANFQADQVLDDLFTDEITRHVNCGCHSCTLAAQQIADEWMYGINPADIAHYSDNGESNK